MTNPSFILMVLTLTITATAHADDATQAFLKTHCIRCHGPKTQKSDRRFDGLGSSIKDLKQLELWQEIVDQLNLGEMPPPK